MINSVQINSQSYYKTIGDFPKTLFNDYRSETTLFIIGFIFSVTVFTLIPELTLAGFVFVVLPLSTITATFFVFVPPTLYSSKYKPKFYIPYHTNYYGDGLQYNNHGGTYKIEKHIPVKIIHHRSNGYINKTLNTGVSITQSKDEYEKKTVRNGVGLTSSYTGVENTLSKHEYEKKTGVKG